MRAFLCATLCPPGTGLKNDTELYPIYSIFFIFHSALNIFQQLLRLQFVNFLYLYSMNVINRKTVIYYGEKYPRAKNQLLAWYNEILKQQFDNFNDLKTVYGNASIVNDQRVVFNIKGNEYRLVVSINFRRKACYTIWFDTHKEYDKINVSTIQYRLNL